MRKDFSLLILCVLCITACTGFGGNKLIFSKKEVLLVENKSTKNDVRNILGTNITTSFNNLNAQGAAQYVEAIIPGSEIKLNEGTYSGYYYMGAKSNGFRTISRQYVYIFDENGILIKKVYREIKN